MKDIDLPFCDLPTDPFDTPEFRELEKSLEAMPDPDPFEDPEVKQRFRELEKSLDRFEIDLDMTDLQKAGEELFRAIER